MVFKKDFLCEFGKYVKSRGDYEVTNDVTPRTHEAISLGRFINLQGTYKVLYIEKVLVLKRCVNTVAPMPDQVIKKTNQWGERTKRE